MPKNEAPCETCGRSPGERKPRCIRCAERGKDRMLPKCLPGRYLVVDAASKSGWARVTGGVNAYPLITDHGECGVWSEVPMVVCEQAASEGVDALVVEVPSPASMGVGGPSTVLGIGKAVGAWLYCWRLACGRLGLRHVVLEVMTISWRPVILGRHHGTEEWKAAARRHVESCYPGTDVGENDADAICLAEYALCSLDLADAVGVRRLSKLGWAEPRGYWTEGRFVALDVAAKEVSRG